MDEHLQDYFERRADELAQLSRKIWEHPEASEHEVYACEALTAFLGREGFTLSGPPFAGLETAFEAKWGEGEPRIAFLAEYDALPGLSQEVSTERRAIPDCPFGHGCGHNLLGVGAVGAAAALKSAMQAAGLPGTVYLYGCPSEEVMLGKIAMTKAGVFDDLDVAISWHPGDLNQASESSYQAMLSAEYHFTGKASHAAMAPQEGFSALDAVELMDVGVNYLREHVPVGGQLHYVILNGGDKPNIVPEKASVWQFMRASTVQDLRRIARRVDEIAAGAALMTGTKFKKKVLTGCNETRIVPALVDLMYGVMRDEIPRPVWTDEEESFSRRILEELGIAHGKSCLHSAILQPTGQTVRILGSSDLSDVSYVVPTCMLFSACYPIGTPNHTWAVTACAGASIGQKGMLYAAKVMASTGLHLVRDPGLRRKVRASFEEALAGASYAPADL